MTPGFQAPGNWRIWTWHGSNRGLCIAHLTFEQLSALIQDGTIETVIVAFPDQFGQLMGKRLTGEYFLERPEAECCSYLLTTDIEMNPQTGFALGSWEQGYGDFTMVPDLATITIPNWLPGTALVIADLKDREGKEVEQSPRAILKRQCRKAAELGYEVMMASELEFYLFAHRYDEVRAEGSHGLRRVNTGAIDYHILGTGYDEDIIGEIRKSISSSGIPVESSKGETGGGQYEVALRYTSALEMADRHVIYKYGAKSIAAAADHSITFMAKYSDADAGSSCHIHCSLQEYESGKNAFCSHSMADKEEAPVFSGFLGGLHKLAVDFCLFFAPTVNSYKRYSPGSFAPTRISWDYDNRTTSFRVVGKGPSFRIENRLPGADANPYLAYAATIAAGLYGIENGIQLPPRYSGNAYIDRTLHHVPLDLKSAADRMDQSVIGRELFGDAVIDHYVRQARLEAAAYAAVVGEWELKRYFEKI